MSFTLTFLEIPFNFREGRKIQCRDQIRRKLIRNDLTTNIFSHFMIFRKLPKVNNKQGRYLFEGREEGGVGRFVRLTNRSVTSLGS